PVAVTFAVYCNHSPGRVHPTSKPPPASLLVSISTSVGRYCPPRLPGLVSKYAIDWPPSSKFSASIVPGSETTTPTNGVAPPDRLSSSRFTLATPPVDPLTSKTSRSRWLPALSGTVPPGAAVHVCQPPVFGTWIGPVTSAPSTSRCSEPPDPVDAILSVRSYWLSAATLTVYWSHSPGRVHPTS